ncbi:glycosyltransferase family 4 protein [Rhodobacter capsulatus]|uniref:Glycosyltransferase involved in cell wall bisynthesis n=1 Tax=Rhodobacter capsulatus TaxID=1061 RepID=A0A1G7CDS3_RHOCA|nr:glycosyltransferase family 4 protein [Rhodobacter capsulatus]WER10656.1 glycosyltransferase family 4 protein [Rhodobacter capsulatus]SDE37441.1 Glycosyltransferase involved in cell wall bisynthesis [Rhodobacter capsulatus]
MKILMVMNAKGVGGAELQFLELANYLAQRHEVHVIGLHGTGAFEKAGLDARLRPAAFPYKSGKRSLPQLVRAVRKGVSLRADVVLSTSFIGNLVALAIAAPFGTRRISLQTVSKAMAYPALDRWVLNRFDGLVAGCKDIETYLLRRGHRQDRITVVSNWVDFSARKPSLSAAETRAKFGLGAETTLIGCIGRMHVQKGQEFLIRAFRKLAQGRGDLRLVLVGDGPTLEEMRKEAAGHPQILFTGTIQGEDYNNLLAAFDIYAQPSRFEGLPRTLLDAMFMGKPIVATAVNGNLDAVTDMAEGLLVPAEDAEALAAALEQLLQDRELRARLSRQAHESAEASFSAQQQLQKIEMLLQ